MEGLNMRKKSEKKQVLVCCGTGCIANGGLDVYQAFKNNPGELFELVSSDDIKATGCHGLCSSGPFVRILPDDITYCQVKASDVEEIIEKSIKGNELIKRLLYRDPQSKKRMQNLDKIAFNSMQVKKALRNVGLINPESLQDYLERQGYQALRKALKMEPEEVVQEIIDAGLRGRGGGGFPTGLKWKACQAIASTPKYIVCNGDEGDPGAFMDESIMEGDPHTILEGMTICAYTVGASKGFIYVRDEYAGSVTALTRAISDAREHGFLGENILGSGLNFDIEIVRGGGAFVCGEETALLASIEGNVGEPWDKYVFPTEKGLWGQPTVINNVETWSNVPLILLEGAKKFASTGTAGSKGTKVFSLVGKVVNTGLVEVPMGTSLRDIIFTIGGGVPGKRKFKAVQTGGPSGGCIPESLLDLKVDFDSLSEAGSMMGSGGMIVMDDRTCMVEVARYYLQFLAGESCGKCVPCREGIRSLLEILERICNGQGCLEDLDLLEDIGETVRAAALCALGRTAPNPVLSTLKYFRDEYLEHIVNHRCPAGICKELSKFYIDAELCNGCGLCAKNCPVDAVQGEKKQPYVIDNSKCIKCGECINDCQFLAVKVR
jgi:NADP-reducing hydrogenase subunit HndC